MRRTAFHDRLVLAGAAFFVCAHLAWLPRHLEDIDSFNFAPGLTDYDVGAHQPHPPGYPVFIVLARLVRAVARAWVMDAASLAAVAMSVLAALAGALALVALYLVLRLVAGDAEGERESRAPGFAGMPTPWLATAITAASPLFWVTASRPLSDMPGLAGAIGCQWLLLRAGLPGAAPRRAVIAAVACGVAVGLRSQVAWLVVPLLVWLLASVWSRAGVLRAGAVAAAAIGGVLTWAVPMVAITGGVGAYRAALASQAGEDFEGVPMLVLQPGVGRLLAVLADTFVWPWGWWPMAALVLMLAVAAVMACRRSGPLVRWLTLGFVPYLLFHVLFQETETTRYALPLVPPVATLVVIALRAWTPRIAVALACVIAVASLGVSAQAHWQYVRSGTTVSDALRVMDARARGRDTRPHVLMHRRVWAETRRARAVLQPVPPYELLPAPQAFEWQGAAQAWREGRVEMLWWLVDPRRGDRAAIDPRAFTLQQHVGWPMPAAAVLGGMRPHPFDWYAVDRPQWVLLDGWGLTPELAGLSAAAGQGPSTTGATALVRVNAGESTLVVGGRYVADASAPRLPIEVRIGSDWAQRADVAPGPFALSWGVPVVPGPRGTYAPLEVRVAGSVAGGPERVFLEQFDLQPAGVPVVALEEGWYEPERDQATGRQWRWVSDVSALRVSGAGSDVRLVVRGTYPRHYDREPVLEMFVGAQRVSRHTLSRPFRVEQRIGAELLRGAAGRISWRVSSSFTAGVRTGSADARTLALEIAAVDVDGIR
jgi:hypothetical protein